MSCWEKAEKFKNPDRLSGAVLRNVGDVSVAEIIAFEGAGVAAAAAPAATPTHWPDVWPGRRARRVYLRTRLHIIIQTADRQHRRLQIQ